MTAEKDTPAGASPESPTAESPAPEAPAAPRLLDHSGFFCFRTPALPFQAYLDWSEGLRAPQSWEDPEALSAALAEDRQRLRARLRDFLARPEIREALYVASPDLEESLGRWIADPDGEKGQRTELALVKYFSRMTRRSTPFGLFAAHSLGRIGERTRLETVGQEAYVRRTRLDMDYLCGLVEALEKLPPLRRTLRYRPNTSLYRAAGRLRYAECHQKSTGRVYKLVAVKEDEFLRDTLQRAKGGATLETLAQALVEPEVTLDEALEYVEDLVDNQALISDLEPKLTGPEPLQELVGHLKACPETAEAAARLDRTRELMEALDRPGASHPPERYRALAQELEELPGKVELSKLIQVDLFKPAPTATLGGEVIAALEEGLQALVRMSPRPNDAFAQFKERFRERYQDRWVPLTQVLDQESGIGFTGAANKIEGAPLLQGLAFGAPAQGGGHGGHGQGGGPSWSRRDLHLWKRLQELEDGEPLALGPNDIGILSEGGARISDSLGTLAVLTAPSQEALDAGDFQLYLQGTYGPSGARMLGRFAHGDPELAEALREHLRGEEAFQPDAVYAEIAHLSEGRMGNVLARPLLRDYEITFLGRSGADEEHQITLDDLLVSVVNGEVVVRSRRLDRRVLPRLASAANYNFRAMEAYKFLGNLQTQGIVPGFGWSWGVHHGEAFLPRVTYGKVVLSRAQWAVRTDELRALTDPATPAERYRAVQAWRKERSLPRFVLLAEGDNELTVDLDNPLSIETFLTHVRKQGALTLLEDFPGHEGLVVTGPEGRFTHELVVPFLRAVPASAKSPAAARTVPQPRPEESAVRHFAPGSEWLFVKLYCGQSTADALLREAVAPFAADALAKGMADGWFFIRYNDPEPHVRLRFHGQPARLWGELLPALQAAFAPYEADGWLWKIQLDTYEQEVGRYGGPENVARMERLFQVDSETCVDLIGAFPGDDGAEARWLLALKGTDLLLQDFGLDLEARLAFATHTRDQYGMEYGRAGTPLEHQLGDRYRKERKLVDAVMDAEREAEHPLRRGIEALRRRSARIAPLVAEMQALRAEGRLVGDFEDMVIAVAHIFVNRAQRSAQRVQEMVIYDFLVRHYESQLARQRKGKGKPAKIEVEVKVQVDAAEPAEA